MADREKASLLFLGIGVLLALVNALKSDEPVLVVWAVALLLVASPIIFYRGIKAKRDGPRKQATATRPGAARTGKALLSTMLISGLIAAVLIGAAAIFGWSFPLAPVLLVGLTGMVWFGLWYAGQVLGDGRPLKDDRPGGLGL